MLTKSKKNIALDSVLEYATKRGWTVFLAPPNAKKSYKSSKHSNGARWGATNDPDEIRLDFKRWPKARIGITTGIENKIFVLEADTPKGHKVDGLASLAALEAENGKLPETLGAESPSGSRHFYFAYPDGADIKNSTSELAAGIDIRGEGGMVIAPPSKNPDGRAYRWVNDKPIADAPKWLLDKINEPSRVVESPPLVPAPDYLIEAAKRLGPGYGKSNHPDNVIARPSIETIKTALAAIGPDTNRDPWFQSLCALYKELGDEDGFTIGDEWSRRGKKYPGRREFVKQWESIAAKDGYAYNIGTIFHHADETDKDKAEADKWRKKIPTETVTDEPAAHDSPSTADSEPKPKATNNLIKSSGEFVEDFLPPDYLIDGILVRQYIYSLTGVTSSGKTAIVLSIAMHVALCLPLGKLEVARGKVLYFAGENPDDVRMRWIKLCEEYKVNPEKVDVYFVDGRPQLSSASIKNIISNETVDRGPFALVIVDTSAAYFEGDDENNNVQAGNHARMLRSLSETVEGGPTILVPAHPNKNAAPDYLVPRGGGAFLNEMDTNLVCRKDEATKTAELHWQVKIRGVDFAPITFKLNAGQTEKLKDTKGRLIWTVTAAPLSDKEVTDLEEASDRKTDDALVFLKNNDWQSISDMAKKLGWFYATGEPNKSLAQRILKKLEKAKLVESQGGTRYSLTPKGIKAAEGAEGKPL